MSASQSSEAPRSLVAPLGGLLVLRLHYSLRSCRSDLRADRQREVSIVRPAQERGVSQEILQGAWHGERQHLPRRIDHGLDHGQGMKSRRPW